MLAEVKRMYFKKGVCMGGGREAGRHTNPFIYEWDLSLQFLHQPKQA